MYSMFCVTQRYKYVCVAVVLPELVYGDKIVDDTFSSFLAYNYNIFRNIQLHSE